MLPDYEVFSVLGPYLKSPHLVVMLHHLCDALGYMVNPDFTNMCGSDEVGQAVEDAVRGATRLRYLTGVDLSCMECVHLPSPLTQMARAHHRRPPNEWDSYLESADGIYDSGGDEVAEFIEDCSFAFITPMNTSDGGSVLEDCTATSVPARLKRQWVQCTKVINVFLQLYFETGHPALDTSALPPGHDLANKITPRNSETLRRYARRRALELAMEAPHATRICDSLRERLGRAGGIGAHRNQPETLQSQGDERESLLISRTSSKTVWNHMSAEVTRRQAAEAARAARERGDPTAAWEKQAAKAAAKWCQAQDALERDLSLRLRR